MDWLVAAVVVAVGVNLDHQRKPLHSFLRGEVCAQAVHRDENLIERKKKLKWALVQKRPFPSTNRILRSSTSVEYLYIHLQHPWRNLCLQNSKKLKLPN